MAIGDDAALAGMALVPGSMAANLLAREDNQTRDFLANGPAYWKSGLALTSPKAASARAALGCPETAATVANGDTTKALRLTYTSATRAMLRINGTDRGELAYVADVDGAHAAAAAAASNANGRVSKGGDTISGQLYLPNSFAAASGYSIGYINGDGRVSKGASSERFKDDITAIDPDSLGDLFPQLHTFVMKDDAGRMERVGYIAERLDEHPDQQRFVVYEREQTTEDVRDGEGNVVGVKVTGTQRRRDANGDPIPESIDFIALLLAQNAQLHERLVALDARVAALEPEAVAEGGDDGPQRDPES